MRRCRLRVEPFSPRQLHRLCGGQGVLFAHPSRLLQRTHQICHRLGKPHKHVVCAHTLMLMYVSVLVMVLNGLCTHGPLTMLACGGSPSGMESPSSHTDTGPTDSWNNCRCTSRSTAIHWAQRQKVGLTIWTDGRLANRSSTLLNLRYVTTTRSGCSVVGAERICI